MSAAPESERMALSEMTTSGAMQTESPSRTSDSKEKAASDKSSEWSKADDRRCTSEWSNDSSSGESNRRPIKPVNSDESRIAAEE